MIKILISNFALVAMALRLAEPGRAPVIRTPGSTLKAVPGKKVYMPCEASGDPEPSITWERDGMPVSLFGNRFSVNTASQALRIFSVKVDDRGNYTCIAKNPFGVDTIVVALIVMIQPECKIISPTNFTFMEVTNQELVCRSRGLPQPSFEWLTNHHQRIRPMKYSYDNMTTSKRLYSVERQIDEEMFESILFFQPITFKDLGNIVCVSFNEVGSSRDTAVLDVHFPPKVLTNHELTRQVFWWPGHDTNLTCQVTGNNLPDILWTRNQQHFHCTTLEEWVHGAEITSTCTITDTNTGGPGNYTCTAENKLGTIIVHNFIVLEIFPPAEVDVRPISSTSDEVLLSVRVPPKENSPQATYVLVSYRLYAESADENPEYERTADVDGQGEATVKLLGVTRGRDYFVATRARNIVGYGPATNLTVNTEMLFHTASPQQSAKKPSCTSQGEERNNSQLDLSTSVSPDMNHSRKNTEYFLEDILERSSNDSIHIALSVTAAQSKAMAVLPGQRSCLFQCCCVTCLIVMFPKLLFYV